MRFKEPHKPRSDDGRKQSRAVCANLRRRPPGRYYLPDMEAADSRSGNNATLTAGAFPLLSLAEAVTENKRRGLASCQSRDERKAGEMKTIGAFLQRSKCKPGSPRAGYERPCAAASCPRMLRGPSWTGALQRCLALYRAAETSSLIDECWHVFFSHLAASATPSSPIFFSYTVKPLLLLPNAFCLSPRPTERCWKARSTWRQCTWESSAAAPLVRQQNYLFS